MDDTGQIPPEGTPDPDAQAPAAATGVNLVQIELTSEQIVEWWTRVEESRTVRRNLEAKWDILFKEYLPSVTEGAEDIKAGIHFRNTHTKKAKVFFRNPELILTPEGPLKDINMDPETGVVYDAQDAAAVKQAVLAKHLGNKGVHAKRMVGECLFDIIAWAGIAFTKLGYRAYTKTIQEPRMAPDPNFQAPLDTSMLGLGPTPQPPMIQALDETGQPMFDPVEVTIHEEWYWNRFSPKKGLLPAELRSVFIDRDAAWIGMEFFLPEATFRSAFKVDESTELSSTTSDDDRSYKHVESSAGIKPKGLIHGVELFYKASIFDPAEANPLAIRQLVMVEGMKEWVCVHRPSPDQTFDELGKLTPDSLRGFPIHVFVNRDMADSPYPWADNAFTNNAVKHINTHRRQSIKLRDANIGKFLYDSGAFTPEELGRLQRGEVGEWIAVQDGRLANGQEKIVAPLVKNEASRDDWRTAQTLKQDVEETLGIGGVNAGNMEDTARTATEIATATSALAERLDDERDFILDIYLQGVEKFDSLLQRYADDTDYVEWVGVDGTKRLAAWNKATIAGRWAYTAKPDSQLKVDVARDRAQMIQLTKELAPYAGLLVNMKPILRKVVGQFGIDPHEVILPDLPGAVGLTLPPPAAPGAGPGTGPPTTGALPNAPSPGKGTSEVQRSTEGPR